MAKFKKILSFFKGSKKRKSVVIHDSRSIRYNDTHLNGPSRNGNIRIGTNNGRPIVGNGGHYEQFLYVDDIKNGGLKKRTLSMTPSLVSSSNYTQTDIEISETLSHLRLESTRDYLTRNGINKGINRLSIGNPNRMNGQGKISNNLSKKVNKSFTLRQDPIEEEKVIVEVHDNSEDEIEIDEDELIAAIEEFDKERKGSSTICLNNSDHLEQDTFILKEDKEDQNGNQSFIIKNVTDDIQAKKLSFILSSANHQIDDIEEENLNTSESFLLSTPNITYDTQDKSNQEFNLDLEGIKNTRKSGYLTTIKELPFEKETVRESIIQFQPPEFSITNEKVYNYRNNDLIKTIFKKIPNDEGKSSKKNSNNTVNDDDDDDVVLAHYAKRKVNFVINNNTKKSTPGSKNNVKFNTNSNSGANATATSPLSRRSSVKNVDAGRSNYTPKPILMTSPTLGKSNTNSKIASSYKTSKTSTTYSPTVSATKKHFDSNNDSSTHRPNDKISNESLTRTPSKREIKNLNENLKQSSSAYTSAVPTSSTRNIFFMPLPRPSQATLLDFGNSPTLLAKKPGLYTHTNRSVGSFPLSSSTNASKETNLSSTPSINRRHTHHPYNENITSPSKTKEGNLYSDPIKASIPMTTPTTPIKSTKENPKSSSKIGTHKLTSNPSSNTLFTSTSLYSTHYRNDKKHSVIDAPASSTAYQSSTKVDTQSFTDSSSLPSLVSDSSYTNMDKGGRKGEEEDEEYHYHFKSSVPITQEDDLDNLSLEPQSDSFMTSTNEDTSYIYSKKYDESSQEESLKHVKEYVQSLDENPKDTSSLFSTPLAYRKRYEKYGSLRSRTSNGSGTGSVSISTSISTSNNNSHRSLSIKKLNSKPSYGSTNSERTDHSISLTEYSNCDSNYSESTSYSYHSNSTAPSQRSIPIKDYYLSGSKKYNTSKPLPLPLSTLKYKSNESSQVVDIDDQYPHHHHKSKMEKFNSDVTVVDNKQNYKSNSLPRSKKYQNSSSVSSGSTLAYSPLPNRRSLINNSYNLNKLSVLIADSNYFDDFMKDLNDMSLNDLITKYEQKVSE